MGYGYFSFPQQQLAGACSPARSSRSNTQLSYSQKGVAMGEGHAWKKSGSFISPTQVKQQDFMI